jgi:hypothetical protein
LKRYVVMLAVMALLMVALTVPAFAIAPVKTVPGQVERGPAHANSICSFSGLNDEPGVDGGLVQSYGQIVAAGGKAFAPSPGSYCNAHIYPYPPGPPPPPE